MSGGTELKKIIDWAATAFGIGGVGIASIFADEKAGYVALLIWALLAIYCGWRVYQATQVVIARQYPQGYLPLSAAAKWTTSDGDNIVFELVRHVQIKKVATKHFEHRYRWTGTNTPKVTSMLQTCSEIQSIPGDMTKVIRLNFSQVRAYNEVEVVHLRMDIDDSDHAADTHLGHVVRTAMRLISFDVELLNATPKYYGEVAKVFRVALENPSAMAEDIATVKFDVSTKSFVYQIPEPAPGYRYAMSWTRPANGTSQRKGKTSRTGQPWSGG